MRSKPKIIDKEEFINQAPITTHAIEKQEDLHPFVENTKEKWPFFNDEFCSLLDGSIKFIRSLSVSIPENEYITIERHIRSLDVSKREWIRRAILTTIKKEQEYCKSKNIWTKAEKK